MMELADKGIKKVTKIVFCIFKKLFLRHKRYKKEWNRTSRDKINNVWGEKYIGGNYGQLSEGEDTAIWTIQNRLQREKRILKNRTRKKKFRTALVSGSVTHIA